MENQTFIGIDYLGYKVVYRVYFMVERLLRL